MVAIDILEWPGMNTAFIVSMLVTLVLVAAIYAYGKRRSPDRPVKWGEAMLGSTYVFFVMFLAFGVVPHQWLVHVQNELGWRADRKVYGPFDVLKPESQGGSFPIEISYLQVGDAIVTLIYVFFVALMIWMFVWWQKRGRVRPAAALPASTYGRPLVRRG